MLRDENVLLAETKTMRDIQKYLDPITGGKFDQYVFVKKDLDVFSIKDLFDNAIAHKQRLSAVFVTESGKSTQSLLGIITAWDLYRVE
jgi:hypothetical protein